MKKISCIVLILIFFSFRQEQQLKLPWRAAGLTEQQAAAHLISRFSFGATPGEIDAVVHEGLENWLQHQLNADLPDDSLTRMLSRFPSLNMSNKEIVSTYPKPGQVQRMAIQAGEMTRDSTQTDKKEYRQQLALYMLQNGLKPQTELVRDLINQKILRARYSNNQLKEVLTDFWFNHFNVSLTKGDDRQFITSYERDGIRPFVLGSFEDLLVATAHSPAMLTYLDNYRSVAPNETATPAQRRQQSMADEKIEAMQMQDSSMQKADVAGKIKKARQTQGLNENYAREIMELHTLGVDGGYTQNDVTQAARVFTGWTLFPMEGNAPQINNLLNRLGEDRMKKMGFVHEGDFFFAANEHDKGAKTILGKNYPACGGYQEGLDLLHQLAHHPSTARFISTKLAIRFVSDHPPASLIDKMANAFMATDGNIRKVMEAMVTAPEFWSPEAIREKTKSPFELTISALRALNAEIQAPYQLYIWISKMGQPIYSYQAPTGFPDRGQYWINTGALLNRMNFGLALAAQKIPGIKINLLALNSYHEPESAVAALRTYSQLLLPERKLDATLKRLEPLLTAPELDKKIDDAANAALNKKAAPEVEAITDLKNDREITMPAKSEQYTLAQVVGIILGSPEFQRK